MYIHALPLGVSYPSRPKILLWSHSSHAGGEDPPLQPPAWLGMIFYFRFLVSSSSNLNLYIQLIMLKLCHFRNKHMLNRKIVNRGGYTERKREGDQNGWT